MLPEQIRKHYGHYTVPNLITLVEAKILRVDTSDSAVALYYLTQVDTLLELLRAKVKEPKDEA